MKSFCYFVFSHSGTSEQTVLLKSLLQLTRYCPVLSLTASKRTAIKGIACHEASTYCCVTSPRTRKIQFPLLLRNLINDCLPGIFLLENSFTKSLPSNGCTCNVALSLSLFVPNSLAVYRLSFSQRFLLATSPVPRLFRFFCGVWSSTDTTAPSLRALFWSNSLVSCAPFQVYYHHPGSRVSLDPVYHIINSGEYLVWALP
jgi:hypothetical protein